jgi:hypothetical protein
MSHREYYGGHTPPTWTVCGHCLIPVVLQNQEVRAFDFAVTVKVGKGIVIGIRINLIPGVFKSKEV